LLLWEFCGRKTDPILFTYPTAVTEAFVKLIASGELIKQLGGQLERARRRFSRIIGSRCRPGNSSWHVAHCRSVLRAGDQRSLRDAAGRAHAAAHDVASGSVSASKSPWFFFLPFSPILINTASGAKNVSAAMVEVARAYLAPPAQILFKVICPAALPFIMAGVRIAIGRRAVGMIVAELFTAITGLGAMLSLYGNIFETAKMFVVIVVLAVLGVGLIPRDPMARTPAGNLERTERAVS